MAVNTAKATVALQDLTRRFDKAVSYTNPVYPRIATTFPSNSASERYAMLGAMPQVREWLGERYEESLRAFDQTVTNQLWESTVNIEETDLEDDTIGLYGPVIDELAMRAAYHPDELLITSAVANTWTCMDGVALFSNSHSWGGNPIDNNLGYTVVSTTAVTTAEMKAAILAARSAMLGYVDDNGKPLIQPTPGMNQWVVMVPLELEQQTREALQATILSNTTNIVPDGASMEVIVNTHLTSAVKFYMFHVGNALRPFIFQARTPLERQIKGLGDIQYKDVKFMTRARYTVAPGAFWNATLTTLST